ncbi:hypothetical protein C5167_022142 [Papaver somniferum]|uniref:Uncharacterized protein n=1 Tax=Papaver somniferum TaxID=3469 RepID=A0A4Y7JI06_PAPSO|nr:hypothetical protein C5167_022142 [Papaver somniferum]
MEKTGNIIKPPKPLDVLDMT